MFLNLNIELIGLITITHYKRNEWFKSSFIDWQAKKFKFIKKTLDFNSFLCHNCCMMYVFILDKYAIL